MPLEESTPGNRAIKRRVSAFYPSLDDVREAIPGVTEVMELAEHDSFLYVPLVAGRRANEILVLSADGAYRLSIEDRNSSRTSPARRLRRSTERACSSPSRRSPETLQRSVLPRRSRVSKGCSSPPATFPVAGVNVGSGWFDAIRLADGQLGLVVGDVVGKGVNAAATMARSECAPRVRARPDEAVVDDDPSEPPRRGGGDGIATVTYVVVDAAAGVCRYTSAGHHRLSSRSRTAVSSSSRRSRVAARLGTDTKYTQDVLELPVGTVLVLYTDGLVERRGQPIDEGLARLRQAVLEGRESRRSSWSISWSAWPRAPSGRRHRAPGGATACRRPATAGLRVPSETGSLDLVRDALRSWVAGTELSRSDAQDVVLAVWEACANSIEHSLKARADELVVRADVTDSRIRISIADTGEWSPSTERVDRGLGLRLIHAMMSSVDIASTDEGTASRSRRRSPRKLEAHDRNPRARIPITRRCRSCPPLRRSR